MTLSYSSRPTCARLVRHLASRLPGWLLLALLPLLAHAGNPVLTLQATVPAGATDVTAFVDQVEVINPATGAVVASAVPNAGFETFTSLGNTTYGYTPAGATWAFASNSGIATNGSAFGNPAAPEGTHVAFLQTTSSGAGSFSQLLPTLAAGYYQLRVRVAQRNLGPANQGVALLLDGREVGRVVPANDGVFHTYTTAVLPFDQLVLRFEAAGSGTTADVTAFVDQVELLLGGTAVSPGIPNAGFENTGSLGTGQQAYVPTGTGWTYSGNAGIMANGYGFGAYTNIEGTHAGFLQSNGTQGTGSANYGKLARGLPLLATGTYTLRLLAAQRNSATADQKIYVYVGSTALSSIVPPNDGSFHSYTPGTFTVAVPTITGFSPGSGAAGTLVTLSGSNLNGATYVSVDGVAVVPTNVSGSSLKFVLPAGLNSPTPSIVVTTPQGLSVPSTAFTVQFNPAISSFSPPSGPLGTVVALTGTDFTGLSSVLVGESPALFTVVSNTSATFTVPRGATSQKVRVSNASSTGLSATAFTVTRPSASTIFPGGANLTTNSTANLNVGTNAAPAVMDVDGDGLLDLLVGNSDGIVARFEQTTANGSVFALVGNLTTNGTTDLSVGTYAAPTVSDVDGDGLLDLLVGNYDGIVARFEQTTANGSVFALVGNLTTDGTTDLNVGTRAAPTVSDVDGDGLLDLLVGNDSGTVQRFEQTTANGSVFALVGNLTTNGTTNLNVGAFAAPAVSDVDGDGLLDLLVGNNSGIVARFEQTTANGGAFAFIGNLTTDGTTALDVGTYAAPTVSDVDGDGLLDLLVGNGSGTVQRYEQADPPTALALAPQAVAENEASGTLVGTFATTDATTGDTFTYTLVAGPGGTDNASFAIGTGPNAGKLVTAAVFDFETKASYTVRVRTTDATGIYYEQAFTISITDVVVDAPTLTSFTPASGPLGTVLTLTGTDFTGLSSVLVGESPALFTVVSNTSATAMVPRGATSQRVRVSNAVGTGLSATAFTVTRPSASAVFPGGANLTTNGTANLNVGNRAAPAVSDVDGDGLLDLLVGNSNGSVQRFEQTTANDNVFALVGTLTTNGTTALNAGTLAAPAVSDVDGDGLLDLLVGNSSGNVQRFEQTTANGGVFAFIGNLTTGTTALSVGTYAVPAVSDVDGDGLLDLLVGNGSGIVKRYEQADPPTALALAPQAVAENAASGTLVGTFATTTGTGTGQGPFTYTLVAGAGGTDNASFAIGTGTNAGKLVTAAVFDFETKASYTVRVRTTDATGLYYEQAFTISITNVLEAPTLTSFTPASGPLGTVLTLTGTDFTGLSSVLVGESPALFTVVSNTSATATVPRGATSQRVRVSNAIGTGLSATAFTVTRPSASAVFPGGANLTTNGTANLNVGNRAAPAVSDVDGDGLLDLLVGNNSGNVRRYEQTTANGSAFALVGNLTTNGTTALNVGTYAVPAVSDVDGDGLLDLLVGNNSGNVQRFEQTTATGGVFALVGNLTTDGTAGLSVGTNAAPTVSDVDGDGLLDLLVGNGSGNVARFEQTTANGSVFALVGNLTTNGTTDLDVGYSAAPAVSDVDGDGLLDLLVGNNSSYVARFEQTTANGSVFALVGNLTTNGISDLGGGFFAFPVVTDVDGDGLLDLLVGNGSGIVKRYEQADPPTALALAPQAVAENAASGTLVGTFATTTGTGTGQGPFTYTLVAGAGSTDNASFAISTGPNAGKLVTAAVFDFETKTSYTVRVRTTDATGLYYEQAFTISITNVLEVPTLTALSAAAELPGMPVVLTGTDFASGSTVSFGGVAASSVTYTSPTSLTAIVPVGAAAGSSAVVVTTTSGSSTGSPAFEVLQVYRNPAASGCLATASISLTGTGGPGVWRYLRLADAGGAVVAAIEDTYNLGTVSAGFTALGTGTSVAVRQDGSHHYYLDRNFYLTATSQTFPGKTVRVRFFGLSSELARLHAADANATAATLNASQYSGANENCELSDNAPAGSRLLAAPATVLSGADWFTAQVSVTDHFSEFYLTGANTPLPVELLTFTARKQGAAVQLDWRTASEKDADRFEVERSPDGLAFASIGTVAAKGTSLTPTDYAFADTRYPSTSRQFYYRLRQVDRDGTAAYSPVRVVTLDDQARLSLYPNPAHSALAVLGAAPGTKLDVLDAVGRVVATATTDADGTAQLTLPTGLAAGVYVVRCGAQVQRLTVE